MFRRIYRFCSTLLVFLMVVNVLPIATLKAAPQNSSPPPTITTNQATNTLLTSRKAPDTFVPSILRNQATTTQQRPTVVEKTASTAVAPQQTNSTYPLEFYLQWDQRIDIDLHIHTPNNSHIWYNNKFAEGSNTLFDQQCSYVRSNPAPYYETISWNNPPATGIYKLEIVLYEHCQDYQSVNTNFQSLVKVNGETIDNLSGSTIGYEDGKVVLTHYFEYGSQYTLPKDVDRNSCPCKSQDPQPDYGEPINTRTGNLWAESARLDVPLTSTGPEIAWTATYNSQAITETLPSFGVGWQHPYATRLILPTMPTGEPNTLIIVSPTGNRYRFKNTTGFEPYPGVYGKLELSGSDYIYTLRDQSKHVFNATTGRLVRMETQDKRILAFDYSNDVLTKIRDASDSQRYLDILYNGSKIWKIQDPFGRYLEYTYNATGDITGIKDGAGRTTTYTYQSNLLTKITNPLGQIVEHTAYDIYNPSGKAISQTLQDGRRINLSYLQLSTIITTTTRDNKQDVETFYYNAGNTLIRHERNGKLIEQSSYNNAAFKPGLKVDGNGNATNTTFNRNGQPTRITNAVGEKTFVRYDNLSRPISVTDSLGRTSLFEYDSNDSALTKNQLVRQTVGINTSNPLGLTTVYTYDPNFPDQLKSELLPEGVRHEYGYDAVGRRTLSKTFVGSTQTEQQIMTYTAQGLLASQSIQYAGEPARLTTYTYDGRGRLTATTRDVGTLQERKDVTQYNADDTVSAAIQNYRGTGAYNSAIPTENITTKYGYDALGRQIWVQQPDGRVDVTHYNNYGELDWELTNLYPVTWNQGQVVIPATPPAYSATNPDRNIATLYEYDGLGQRTKQTEVGFVTRTLNPEAYTRSTQTGYDTLSRPVTVTTTLIKNNQVVDTKQTLTYYDKANNVIGARDAYNRWTCIEYDALNRPTKTIRNCEDGNPSSVSEAWATVNDTDLITFNTYQQGGQLDYRIENFVNGVFDSNAPTEDRVTDYVYTPLGQLDTTIANRDSSQTTRTDTNIATKTTYDAFQRPLAYQDALGRWVKQEYDAFGRVTATTLNCRDAQGNPSATTCTPFSTSRTDRNVRSQIVYNAAGRVTDQIDVYGRVNKTRYTLQGQVSASIQNYVLNAPTSSMTNVTTLTSYDIFGRTSITTDAIGLVTRYSYDVLGRVKTKIDPTSTTTYTYNALGQLISEVDSVRGTTTYQYDGRGNRLMITRGDGQVTYTTSDVQGGTGGDRIITTIQNYRANETAPDANITTSVGYDDAGRVWQQTNAAGQRMVFTYDLFDRLVVVIENVVVGPGPTIIGPDVNVETHYEYDRMGNRTTITDANNHQRTFKYDALDRKVEATDALTQKTIWTYDKLSRLTFVDDPRGATYDLTYTYDELDHLAGLATSTATTLAPITWTYDALGLRKTMTDGSGTTTFGYDPLGRTQRVTTSQGTVTYGYDAKGQRTSLGYPDGTQINYSYTPNGLLDLVAQGTTVLANYDYDAWEKLIRLNRSNGTLTTYQYDRVDRVQTIATTAVGGLVHQIRYNLNQLGQRVGVEEKTRDEPILIRRINSAATNNETYSSNNWNADQYFVGGMTDTRTIIGDVTETADDGMYTKTRVASTDGGSFSYAIPVSTTGKYLVRLHFAETWFGAPGGGTGAAGARRFNVNLEGGALELANYDIYADVGAMRAVVKQYTIDVTDTTINIDFTTIMNRAIVSGIEVFYLPVTPEVIARVDVGSSVARTFNGIVWSSDSGYSASQTSNASAIPNIRGTNDDDLYRTTRISSSTNGSFSYSVAVTRTGQYLVRLHFAETWWGATGGGSANYQRVFSVNLEGGALELQNYNIAAEVGSMTAVIKPYIVTVTDGVLNIDLTASADRPILSAFEVFFVPTVTPTTLTRINSAASAPENYSGATWSADQYFVGGRADVTTTIPDILGTNDDGMYTKTRTATADGGSFSYTIPLSQTGVYRVRLHFAETYWGATGGGPGGIGIRRFNVNLEGGMIELPSYDIYADVGAMRAVVKEFIVPIEDGILNIDFTTVSNRPLISGIEVALVVANDQRQARTYSDYAYDNLGRLVNETTTGQQPINYGYDAVGNRTSITRNGTTTTIPYNAANQVDNQVAGYQAWQYDAAGNLLNDGTRTYAYDALGRVTTLGSTTNTYNGDGVLVSQANPSYGTTFVNDLVSDLSQPLVVQRGPTYNRTVYGIERLNGTNDLGIRTWYLSDGVGSVQTTLNDSGNRVTNPQYDAWGNVTNSTIIASFGFTGEYRDPMSGLTYLRARWYNPTTGTLLGRDPFDGYAQQPYSSHYYQYGYSDPVSNTDPSGKIAIFVGGKDTDKRNPSLLGEAGVWDLGFYIQALFGWEIMNTDWTKTADIVAKLQSFSNKCKVEPIILVGHSYGGKKLMEITHEHPDIHVDMLITLGVVGFDLHRNERDGEKDRSVLVYGIKPENVDLQANYMSDPGHPSEIERLLTSTEWPIRDATNIIMGGTGITHTTLDNQEYTDYTGVKHYNHIWTDIIVNLSNVNRTYFRNKITGGN